jgi:hypothetical protein
MKRQGEIPKIGIHRRRPQGRAFDYFSQIANAHPNEPPGTAQARIVANAFLAPGHYYLKGIPNTTVAPDAVRARDMFAYAASYFGDTDAQYQLGRPLAPTAKGVLIVSTRRTCTSRKHAFAVRLNRRPHST